MNTSNIYISDEDGRTNSEVWTCSQWRQFTYIESVKPRLWVIIIYLHQLTYTLFNESNPVLIGV